MRGTGGMLTVKDISCSDLLGLAGTQIGTPLRVTVYRRDGGQFGGAAVLLFLEAAGREEGEPEAP